MQSSVPSDSELDPAWADIPETLDKLERCLHLYAEKLMVNSQEIEVHKATQATSEQMLQAAQTRVDQQQDEIQKLQKSFERQQQDLADVAETKKSLRRLESEKRALQELANDLQQKLSQEKAAHSKTSMTLEEKLKSEQSKLAAESRARAELQSRLEHEQQGRAEAQRQVSAAKQEMARMQLEAANQCASMKSKYEDQILRLGADRSGGSTELLRAKIVSLQAELAEAKSKPLIMSTLPALPLPTGTSLKPLISAMPSSTSTFAFQPGQHQQQSQQQQQSLPQKRKIGSLTYSSKPSLTMLENKSQRAKEMREWQ